MTPKQEQELAAFFVEIGIERWSAESGPTHETVWSNRNYEAPPEAYQVPVCPTLNVRVPRHLTDDEIDRLQRLSGAAVRYEIMEKRLPRWHPQKERK